MTKVINEIKIKVKENLTSRVSFIINAGFFTVLGGVLTFIISASVFFVTANGEISKLKAEVVQITEEKEILKGIVENYIESNNIVNTQISGKIDGLAMNVQTIIQLVSNIQFEK